MVCARDKDSVIPFHAMIAHEDVLEVHIECVTNMQIAIGVWRRHNYRVWLSLSCR